MKKMLSFSLFCAIALPLNAIEINSYRGKVNAPDAPQTVVSYDIGVIDTLRALDVPLAGVPSKLYVDYLDVDNVPAVGSLFEPDMEKLNAIAPDWVVVASRSSDQLDNVKQIAPAADLTLRGKDHYQETLQRLQDLAAVFDKKDKASSIENQLNTLRDKVKAKVPADNNTLLLLLTGPKMSVYGKASRAGWFEQTLGFNLIEGEKSGASHGTPVSFEYIAEANPDWLLVIDRAAAIGNDDVANAQTILDNPLVAQTTAWQKGQVIYLNPADIYIAVGGVQALERVLMQLDKALPEPSK